MKNVIKTYQNKKVVENFDKEREEFEYQKYKTEIESTFLEKAINEINPAHPPWKFRILDVGCGTGRMLYSVLAQGWNTKYYGLDTSKEMTNILKSKINPIERKFTKIVIGNATKIPFKDNFFDMTFSYHLLWHLPKEKQEQIIKEMFRVTRKGGFIVFDTLNPNFVWEKIKRKKTKGIYKFSPELINLEYKIEKLNDAKFPDAIYKIFNITNKCRKVLPNWMFHMIYFRVRKNEF